jgi:hypothetical protein
MTPTDPAVAVVRTDPRREDGGHIRSTRNRPGLEDFDALVVALARLLRFGPLGLWWFRTPQLAPSYALATINHQLSVLAGLEWCRPSRLRPLVEAG